MKCVVCKKECKNNGCVCDECVGLAMRKLTDQQYLDWLVRMRKRILNGLELEYWDDDTIGNKDSYCSWGMCANNIESYSDKETWAYKEMTELERYSRLRVIGRDKHQWCPFDSRINNIEKPSLGAGYGCFYACKIFNGKVRTNTEAVVLFDRCIAIATDIVKIAILKRGMQDVVIEYWDIQRSEICNLLSPIYNYFELSEKLSDTETVIDEEFTRAMSEEYKKCVEVLARVKRLLNTSFTFDDAGKVIKKEND